MSEMMKVEKETTPAKYSLGMSDVNSLVELRKDGVMIDQYSLGMKNEPIVIQEEGFFEGMLEKRVLQKGDKLIMTEMDKVPEGSGWILLENELHHMGKQDSSSVWLKKAEDFKSNEQERISKIKEELINYGEMNKLRGLEGRIQRGLDPAGMLAVGETKIKVEKIAENFGASLGDVVKVTNELHVGAIWNNADELAKGENPAIKTWMVLAEITTSGKEKEGDLTEEEFLRDLERVEKLLSEASSNTEGFFSKARENLIENSKNQFSLEDGVPISDLDSGFLAMAINGYHAGIVSDRNNNLFVGANKLDYDVLLKEGLSLTEKEDRGRLATFYQNKDGQDLVKKLYQGLAIILGDANVPDDIKKDIAIKLAQTGEQLVKEQKH